MKPYTVHARASILRDFVLGSSDGIVTTFAVVAGAIGASLSFRVIIILGFAKLLSDALSMFAGIYLGAKSEIDLEKKGKDDHKDIQPLTQGIITFFAFLFVGFLPLIPFVFAFNNAFVFSMILVSVVLFVVGSIRAESVGKKFFKGGFEMLFVGGIAAFAAYFVGFLLDKFVL